MRRAAAAFAALLIALAAAAALAGAASANDLTSPPALDEVPAGGYRLTEREALRIADRLPEVREARAEAGRSTRSAFLKPVRRWQVSYYDAKRDRSEIAQVQIDDATGAVLEVWTDYKVPWTMARGYDGAFGRKINSPFVWVPLAILFVLPFIDWRRPLRMLHLDLLVLTGFSVAYAFFNQGDIDISTPLTTPLLLYVLARMLWIGLRPKDTDRPPDRPLPLLVPALWLGVAAVFLLGFRLGLNVLSSNVIDVGYSGVIGADKLANGLPLYGAFPDDNASGDTYGPLNYLLYVPFEQIFGWSGRWDTLPAAHAAALVFDLLCVGLLFQLGRQLRGTAMGITLVYAWVAFPFTTFATNTNANDALPAALTIAALVAATSPGGRGILIGMAGLTKLAQLGLIPVFATYRWSEHRVRTIVLFGLGLLIATILALATALLHQGSLREFYDATLSFQADRLSPFTPWGLYDGLDTVQTVVQVLGVLFGVAVAFLPRRQDVVGLAALSAAVLIALQLGLGYWFFLYVVWWIPLVLVALLGRDGEPELR
ncbi:MAG: DUF2029 domain-containing protein [Solirubrobacteraceae bacterium]|nr:DUF2029 domain-containing protein [Solirubrobacteraceae bacterium]